LQWTPQRGDEALERPLLGKPGMRVEERQLAAVVRIHELACSHVLDHALTQRTDSFSVAHGEFHPE